MRPKCCTDHAFGFLNTEDWIDRLSQNVGKK